MLSVCTSYKCSKEIYGFAFLFLFVAAQTLCSSFKYIRQKFVLVQQYIRKVKKVLGRAHPMTASRRFMEFFCLFVCHCNPLFGPLIFFAKLKRFCSVLWCQAQNILATISLDEFPFYYIFPVILYKQKKQNKLLPCEAATHSYFCYSIVFYW